MASKLSYSTTGPASSGSLFYACPQNHHISDPSTRLLAQLAVVTALRLHRTVLCRDSSCTCKLQLWTLLLGSNAALVKRPELGRLPVAWTASQQAAAARSEYRQTTQFGVVLQAQEGVELAAPAVQVGPDGVNRNAGKFGSTIAIGPCRKSADENRSAMMYDVSISFRANSYALA